MATLERLTQHFKHTAIELWEFVTKQYSIMRKTYLSRLRIGTSSDKRH
jgi:hypothetical protein